MTRNYIFDMIYAFFYLRRACGGGCFVVGLSCVAGDVDFGVGIAFPIRRIPEKNVWPI